MDTRSKDSIRNTEKLVGELVVAVNELTDEVVKLRKELTLVKRSTVRQYKKKNG